MLANTSLWWDKLGRQDGFHACRNGTSTRTNGTNEWRWRHLLCHSCSIAAKTQDSGESDVVPFTLRPAAMGWKLKGAIRAYSLY